MVGCGGFGVEDRGGSAGLEFYVMCVFFFFFLVVAVIDA